MKAKLNTGNLDFGQTVEIHQMADEFVERINAKWPGLSVTCYDEIKFVLLERLNKSANLPTGLDQLRMMSPKERVIIAV
jgi:hypothetical protein